MRQCQRLWERDHDDGNLATVGIGETVEGSAPVTAGPVEETVVTAGEERSAATVEFEEIGGNMVTI